MTWVKYLRYFLSHRKLSTNVYYYYSLEDTREFTIKVLRDSKAKPIVSLGQIMEEWGFFVCLFLVSIHFLVTFLHPESKYSQRRKKKKDSERFKKLEFG
jgi:hypothetical protein